jgi:hypothetical protein
MTVNTQVEVINMKKTQNRILLTLGLLLILLQPVSGTEVVQIQAGRDNTLFWHTQQRHRTVSIHRLVGGHESSPKKEGFDLVRR